MIEFKYLIVAVIAILAVGRGVYANGEDIIDIMDGDDEEVQVEMENIPVSEEPDIIENAVVEKEETDDEEERTLLSSPDADTYFLFTKPSGSSLEIPAGKDVQFLVGFTNKGVKDFVVETMDASFRYPVDFSFYIQNFSTIAYNRLVKPKQQATFFYTFYVSETFSSRPFGLTVHLLYADSDGKRFLNAVFNDTVNVVEIDEGLDGETFFLYVLLAACGVLVLVGGQQFLASFGKKRPTMKQKIEMGTQNANDVDYDWLPKETLQEIRKSPRKSPRQSPRQRRARRRTGNVDE
ncbi:translocon-associated protein subunit alpha-like [Centruroides vittatus]|uniref:translocon-associated protein subunit alpha-like n=1 Tax=Centruroides vittatus TaxID=120091 RepID=UPI00350EA246